MVKGRNKMKTLHEAMLIMLNETNGIPIAKLAFGISSLGLYLKRDGSELKSNQIKARVHQYPHLFYIEDGKVYKK